MNALLPWATLLATLLATLPQQADDVFAEARKLRMAGQSGAAADLLAVELARDRGNLRLVGLRGLCLLDAGRVPEARALAAELAGYAGDEPRVHVFLGRASLAAEDLAAAAASFERALALDSDLVEASIGAVQTALAAGQFGAAVEEAAHLQALAPEQGRRYGAQALVAQAHKLRAAGDERSGLAIEKLRAALALQPGDRAILRQLVDGLILDIRIVEARELLREHFADAAHAAEFHYYLGRCFDALTETEGAQHEYLAALAVDAAHALSLLELARQALEDDRAEDARGYLASAAAAEPPSSRGCLLLGLAETALGNDDAAERSLREALRLDPRNTKALYHLGRLLVRRGQSSEGEALLAQVEAAQTR